MKKKMINQQIENLAKQQTLRFHMPGHKGKRKDLLFASEYDYTEVPGADNLHQPEGMIAEAQDKMARIYGSEESAILVNGTTTGLQSAIMGCFSEGDRVLIPVNCHRSVYAGLALGGVEGVYFMPECDPKMGFASEVLPEQAESLLRKYPDVKGMLLVSPTYYGTVSDVRKIAEILHREGKILIVDEAHGAHLKFSERLPEDSVTAGADIVVQSTHKILGSFTQSSLLHFQGERVDRSRVKRFLAMLQSSSPSYPLMMSVENAVDEAADHGAAVFEAIADFWDACQEKGWGPNLTLYGRDQRHYDKSKWLFQVKRGTGLEVEKRLFESFNIQCEMSGGDHVLAMTGIGTTRDELEKLVEAIRCIDPELTNKPPAAACCGSHFNYNQILSMREALFTGEICKVPLRSAAGMTAGDFIIPYPPGIPAILPGGRIDQTVIDDLLERKRRGETIVGMDENGRITIIP